MSKVRRLIKEGRLEYAQPAGPGTDIYVPEDAFERLVIKPVAIADQQKQLIITQQQKRRSGPRPRWQSE